ncbi:MAG: NADPH-dependent FMN reductase [Frankia sp.]
MSIAVVVGNPKIGSRTLGAGLDVAALLAPAIYGGVAPDPDVVELAPLGPKLFGWGDDDVAAAKATVLAADLLIVASPTYKAAPTGLLKAFLDQFDRDELAGRATVPVMVGAAPVHALAVETLLRPVLIEIGASCPTRGVFLLESQLGDVPAALAGWLPVNLTPLAAVVRAHTTG